MILIWRLSNFLLIAKTKVTSNTISKSALWKYQTAMFIECTNPALYLDILHDS